MINFIKYINLNKLRWKFRPLWKKDIEDLYNSLRDGNENFKLTKEGKIDKYLGVELLDNGKGSFEARQPHLIERIIKASTLNSDLTNARPTPATLPLLHRDPQGSDRKYKWNYRAIVGMLNYLTGSTRPDLAMAVHQVARFSNDPKLSHEKAIIRICRYLMDTPNKGMVFAPTKELGLELFVDA